MNQVIISGKLEKIVRAEPEAPLGTIGIHEPYSILVIRTPEGNVAGVKFCNVHVPSVFKGKEVMYIHDVNRGQSLMTGRLVGDEENAGISLESPKVLGVIPTGVSPVVQGNAPRYLDLDYFYAFSQN